MLFGPSAIFTSELDQIRFALSNPKFIDKDLIKESNTLNAKIKYIPTNIDISGYSFQDILASDEFDEISSEPEVNEDVKTIALIPIVGVMQKEYSWWYKTANVAKIKAMVRDASDDTGVAGIIMYCNTGGGSIGGVQELADEIRLAVTKKPVVSALADVWASAGVWSTAFSTELHALSTTSVLGSIGVMMVHQDLSAHYLEHGLVVNYLTSQGSERKVESRENKPLTDEVRENLVQHLTDLNSEFKASVRGGRGDRLKDEGFVFQGHVFTPKEALKAGLIDGISSLDDIVQRVNKLAQSQAKSNSNASSQSGARSRHSKAKASITNSKKDNIMSNFLDSRYGMVAKEDQVVSAEQLNKLHAELSEYDNLKASVATLNKSVEALTSEKSDLEAKLVDLESKLTAKDEKIAGLQANLDAASAPVAKEGDPKDDMPVAKEKEAEKDSSTAPEAAAPVEGEASIQDVMKTLAELQASVAALSQENETLKAENEELTEEVNEIEAEAAAEVPAEVVAETQTTSNPNTSRRTGNAAALRRSINLMR